MEPPDLRLPSERVKKPNLYVDCNSFGAKAIELGVDLYGADKIMFATDGTDFSTEWSNKAIAEARLDASQPRQILHENAARIIGHLTQLAPTVEHRAAAE